ncbi:MAG: glycosyltransferase family 2 protein [Phycisphaerae bacterium]|nr:glycosyltransferase family 2 protein [Phycisphaerae bacterium]
MAAFRDFSESLLRSHALGPSVNLRSDGLSPTPAFSIVIPALNEQAVLPILIQQIETALRGHFYEVVIVDDGSTDNTWREIQAAVKRHSAWQGIRLTRRFGHQAALIAGLKVARGRAVITMDADGQHPPRLIPAMLEKWRDGARVVEMVRSDKDGASFFKRTTSRLFGRIFSALSDVPMPQASSDFRLLDRGVVDIITRDGSHVPFLRGLVAWLGCDSIRISYETNPRISGESKYSLIRMISLAIHGLMSFSIAPLRLATFVGMGFAGLSFVYLCYIAYIGIFSPRAVSGWASIAGLIALLSGVQLVCIGLLGEYLGRLFTANLGRPSFVIAESCGAAGRACAGVASIDTTAPHGNETEFGSIRPAPVLRRHDAVNLITARIGAAETDLQNPDQSLTNIESRIRTMRLEEASYATQTT